MTQSVIYSVSLDRRRRLLVRTPFEAADLMRRVPDARMWDASLKVWVVTPSRVNVGYLRKTIPQLVWDRDAQDLGDDVLTRGTPPPRQSTDDYTFAERPPYAHQREGFALSRGAPAFALLMEQRTGKTRVLIDVASDLYLRSLIDTVLIICPNSVKSVWEEQIPEWTPRHVPHEVVVYGAGDRKRVAEAMAAPPAGLRWLVVNVEAFSTTRPRTKTQPPTGAAFIEELLEGRKTLGAIDEATRIKTPGASRTKFILKLRDLLAYRRILTGTLITKTPLDAYCPFKFLDPAILGFSSYYSFRNDVAIMGGYGGKQVIAYSPGALERLAALIKPFSYRITRDQCFDLPPKQYSKRIIELTAEQRRVYESMRDKMAAELSSGQRVTAAIVLVQLLRLQQIVGGFIPDVLHAADAAVVAIPGPNPKLEALMEELEEIPHKVVIWARFRPEIALIAARLRAAYGDATVVEFHGGVKEADRTVNRRRFQDLADTCRFLVGQPGAGGLGIPLHAARHVVYFSNSFSLEERLQSEDRTQGAEQQWSVDYLDIVAKDTNDLKILKTLRENKSIADLISGDSWKEWI